MRVEVVRSERRRTTVQARQVGEVLQVRVPASMSAADEASWVEEMVRRVGRRRTADPASLRRRATRLARTLDLPRPTSIRWVADQGRRWGSCTPADGTIRLAEEVAAFPGWVVDYVVVHELAHLVEPSHSAAFWQLVARYPLAERARGFLIAKGLDGA